MTDATFEPRRQIIHPHYRDRVDEDLPLDAWYVKWDPSGDFTGKIFPRYEMREMVRLGGMDEGTILVNWLEHEFVYTRGKLKTHKKEAKDGKGN